MRKRCALVLAGLLFLQALPAWAQPAATCVADGGIGGTGVKPEQGGMGGTGASPQGGVTGGTGAVAQGGGTGGTGTVAQGGGTGGTGAVAQGGGTGGTGTVAQGGGTGGTGISADGGIGGTGRPATLAGRVLFASGRVEAQLPGGAPRALGKGDPVCEGETLNSGAKSLLQLVTVDGATLVLRPGTQLEIEAYAFSGSEDGTEKTHLRLLRGGVRAITGRIGHTRKAAFIIRTETATVGILGTDHETFFVPRPTSGEGPVAEPGTYNRVISGGTVLSTPTGSLRIHPRQVGFAGFGRSQPRILERPPEFLGAPLSRLRRDAPNSSARSSSMEGDVAQVASGSLVVQEVNIFGTPLDLQTYLGGLFPAPVGGAYVGVQHVGPSVSAGGVTVDNVGSIVLLDGVALPGSVSSSATGFNYTANPAVLMERGAVMVDGAHVVWGLYAGGTSLDGAGQPVLNDYHHFAFAPGGATPDAVVRSLTGSATFATLVRNSSPTNELGGVGGTLNLSVQVQLGASASLIDYNLSVLDANARNWTGRFTGTAPLSVFGTGGVPLNVTCTGGGCGSGLGDPSRSLAVGQLLGAGARGLITTYGLATTTGQVVAGSAVLMRP